MFQFFSQNVRTRSGIRPFFSKICSDFHLGSSLIIGGPGGSLRCNPDESSGPLSGQKVAFQSNKDPNNNNHIFFGINFILDF